VEPGKKIKKKAKFSFARESEGQAEK